MLRSIRDADLKNKVVLLRVDYNVPLEGDVVKDDTRMVRSLPTINYLLENNASLILVSHLGRPEGKVIPNLSLKPVAKHLSTLINREVKFVNSTVGVAVRNEINKVQPGQVILLENTRFNLGEKSNDSIFAKELASYADIFVSDAFGTVHRAHASTVGVSSYLPSYAGFLVQEEYERITKAMDSPQIPALAIFGGAKVSTKLDIMNKFLEFVNILVIGGGMAYTFLKAKGYEVGNSLLEVEMIDTAKELLLKAEKKGIEIILPIDIRVSKSFEEAVIENGVAKIAPANDIPIDMMGLDIGPESEKLMSEAIKRAKTIIWNGPMGVFEKKLYRSGTTQIAKAVIERNVNTIIGGGDTAYAINLVGIDSIPKNIHISTGGGACLELLSGLTLPGIECLKQN